MPEAQQPPQGEPNEGGKPVPEGSGKTNSTPETNAKLRFRERARQVINRISRRRDEGATPHEVLRDLADHNTSQPQEEPPDLAGDSRENDDQTDEELTVKNTEPEDAEKESDKAKERRSLAEHVQEVRADVQARVQRVIHLAGQDQQVTGAGSNEQITSDAVSDQLNQIGEDEADADEFLMKSRQAVRDAKQASAKDTEQASARETKIAEQRARIAEIDRRRSEIQEQGTLKRAAKFVESERLASERNRLSAAVNEFTASQENIRRLESHKLQVEKKHDEVLAKEAAQEVKIIVGKYETLADEVLQDEALIEDVQDVYIDTVLRPTFDFSLERNFTTSEEVEEYIAALKRGIKEAHSGEKSIAEVRSTIQDLGLDKGLSIPAIQASDRLIKGEDRQMILSIISGAAGVDIQTLNTVVNNGLLEKYSPLQDEILKTAAPGITRRQPEDTFGLLALKEVRGLTEIGNIPDMALWQAVKNSTAAQERFGDLLDQQDSQYLTALLRASRRDTDGVDIDKLRYFPHPDTVKQLVLLQGAESYGYVVAHANKVLTEFAGRSDWPQVLEQSLEKYPELQSVAPFLAEWNQTQFSVPDNFAEAAAPFYKHVWEEESAKQMPDNDTMNLAYEGLPNGMRLEILVSEGKVSEADATKLREAQEIVTRFNQTTTEENPLTDAKASFAYVLEQDLLELGRREEYKSFIRSTQESIANLAVLAQEIREKASDPAALTYLQNRDVINYFNGYGEKYITILSAYQDCPIILQDSAVLSYFVRQYNGNETIQQFNELSSAYDQNPELVSEVMFFTVEGNLTHEQALLFSQHATGLMSDSMKPTREFIFRNNADLLATPADVKFLNNLVGENGQKADQMIRGYKESLDTGAITKSDQQLILEFTKEFRVILPSIVQGYKEAKAGGFEEAYIAELQSLAQKMAGNGTVSEQERAKPYFTDLLQHVYPNNAGNFTSYEQNNSCSDRSGDLAEFSIQPQYTIDLLSQSIIRVKEGESVDQAVKESVQAPIYDIAKRIQDAGGVEALQEELVTEINTKLQEIKAAGGLQGIDIDGLTTAEEKLFLVFTDSLYGTGTIDKAALKNIMLTHEFVNYQDVEDYIRGTNDRVALASNYDYALFCEVNEFYSDRIKEVNRKIVQEAWDNPAIADAMQGYFEKVSQETQASGRREAINKLQVDKLGMSDAFLQQMSKTLKAKSGREYTPDQLRRIVERYERLVEGSGDERVLNADRNERQHSEIISSIGADAYEAMSKKQQRKLKTREELTQTFYGQLRSQRERSAEALQVVTGEAIDPKTLHLGEVNLQEMLDAEAAFQEGRYDPEQFAVYTTQRFLDLFEEEKILIQRELSKFESEDGKGREVLNAYITKSKESAHARMVGGVCVSGDNPSKGERNMWDMPNYTQIVLQDPDTLICQGIVLMHQFTENGKKVLSVSLNPSSTYLYSVDAKALFTGLMNTVETFAADNGFDTVALSQNKTVRTNRTGGEFEHAMDERIAQVDKSFRFQDLKQFSYSPAYKLAGMDVVWENTAQ